MMSSRNVGEKIRALRLKKGLSQAALADMVGIRQATLYRQECGQIQAPKAENLIKIAAALGVPPHRLMTAEIRPRKGKRGRA